MPSLNRITHDCFIYLGSLYRDMNNRIVEILWYSYLKLSTSTFLCGFLLFFKKKKKNICVPGVEKY